MRYSLSVTDILFGNNEHCNEVSSDNENENSILNEEVSTGFWRVFILFMDQSLVRRITVIIASCCFTIFWLEIILLFFMICVYELFTLIWQVSCIIGWDINKQRKNFHLCLIYTTYSWKQYRDWKPNGSYWREKEYEYEIVLFSGSLVKFISIVKGWLRKCTIKVHKAIIGNEIYIILSINKLRII